MLNDAFTVTALSAKKARIGWSASSADVLSYVFMNGSLIVGGYGAGAIERSIEVSFVSGATSAIEVHDCADGEVPRACESAPPVRPTFVFNRVADAAKYKIYVNGITIKEIPQSDAQINKTRCPANMQKGWHKTRVESFGSYGQESDRGYWWHRILDLPDAISVSNFELNFIPYTANAVTYNGDILTYNGDLVTYGE